MKFHPIRWAGRDRDRYLGPFTFTPRGKTSGGQIGLELGSGDGDDYPGCRLRIEAWWFTLHVQLPAIIKPWREWVEITTEPTRSQMIASGRKPGYWDMHEREYGFFLFEGAIHFHYGPLTHDSRTTKSKVWFYPWREHNQVRHSLYDLEGKHFATLPDWGLRNPHGWTVRNAIEAVCPVQRYDFRDFDGEIITATCKIEEREWRRGKGIFRLLFLGRNKVRRSLDLQFSAEVGRRKESWKGGTIGHSIDMLPGELHQSAFERYCQQQGLTFLGERMAAQVPA